MFNLKLFSSGSTIRNFDVKLYSILKIISKIHASDNKRSMLSFLKRFTTLYHSLYYKLKKVLLLSVFDIKRSITLSLRKNYNTLIYHVLNKNKVLDVFFFQSALEDYIRSNVDVVPNLTHFGKQFRANF